MADAKIPKGWAPCVDATCPVRPPKGREAFYATRHLHPASDPRTKREDATREALHTMAEALREIGHPWFANVACDVARYLPLRADSPARDGEGRGEG
jgi:hypothetical protein